MTVHIPVGIYSIHTIFVLLILVTFDVALPIPISADTAHQYNHEQKCQH